MAILTKRKRSLEEDDITEAKKVKPVLENNEDNFQPTKEEENILAKINERLLSRNKRMLRIQPVPKHCPQSLLLDLCPTAYAVQFPNLNTARFAFLIFRNEKQLLSAQAKLDQMKLNDKDIKTRRALEKFNEDLITLNRFDMKTLQVLDLPEGTTKFDLGKLFPKAIDLEITKRTDGKISTSCQLKYKNPEECLEDFTKHESSSIRDRPIYVNYVIKSQSKKRPEKNSSKTVKDLKEMEKDDENSTTDESDEESCETKKNSMDIDGDDSVTSKKKKSKAAVNIKQPYQKRPKGTASNSVKIKKNKFKKK